VNIVGSIFTETIGDAIANIGGVVNISGTVVSRNGGAGLSNSNGAVTISSSLFINNHSVGPAAIASFGSRATLHISDSRFTGNSASSVASAPFVSAPMVSL
jgi:hypothetical protein